MPIRPLLLSLASVFLASAGSAKAAITLTIVEFTNTTFTVSISGTLEKAADLPTGSGASPSWFFITLNGAGSTAFYTGSPVLQSGAFYQGGSYAPASMTSASSGQYAMAFAHDQVFPLPAGLSLSGSATFTGNFNPSAAQPQDFQLWSGIGSAPNSPFSVYHVNAVPETSSLVLSLGLGGLLCRRKRR